MLVHFKRHAQGYFLSPTATLTGEIDIASDASFWFGAVVRGDVARVSIGARVNVQDNAVVHCDHGVPNIIEDDVSIGHSAIVHGKRVGRGTLIGMGAKVLGQTQIGEGCLIGAGSLVPPRMVVPDGSLVMGVPGKIVRQVSETEREYLAWLTRHYVELANRYVVNGFTDHTR